MNRRGIVFCIPGYGHVNPSLPIIKELVDRGHEIDYCCTIEFKELIEQTGASFIPFPYDIGYSEIKNFSVLDIFGDILKYTYLSLGQLIKYVEGGDYDYIINDYYTLWGRLITEKINIPTAIINPAFAMHKELKEPTATFLSMLNTPFLSVRGGLKLFYYFNQIKKKYKVPLQGSLDDLLKGTVDRPLLSCTIEKLQPQVELFPPNYHFIGTSIDHTTRKTTPNFPIHRVREASKVVYISLGSVLKNNHFFQLCIDALKDSEYLVVLNIGQATKRSIFQAPSNFIICNFAPQLEILEHATVFISHVGMNSAHESILYQVPIIAVPQVSDQFLVAQTIQQKKLGVWIDSKQISANKLKATIQQISTDKKIALNLKEMSQLLKNAGGPNTAADIIEREVIPIHN